MTKTRLIVSAFVLATIAYLGTSAFVIANQRIEELLICADEGGLKVPFSKALCRHYLFAFRGTPEDIEALHQGTGASFVVQGNASEHEREQVLQFLIAKGLDVNHEDMHLLTPLHGAVVANAADEVALLLRNGANARLKDGKFALTPLELARKLQNAGATPDRRAVISLLDEAK